MLLNRLADIVVNRHKLVLVVTVLLTIFFAIFLPGVSIQSDITEFLPESEPLKDQYKINDYFGQDPYIHVVSIKAKPKFYGEDAVAPERNVLTPPSLREQYNLTQTVLTIDGVDEVQSIAGIFDELVKYSVSLGGGMRYNPNMTLVNASNSKIDSWINILHDILSGEKNISDFVDTGDMPVDVEELEFALQLLLTKDFNADNFTAEGTLITVKMNGSLERFEARYLAGDIRTEIRDQEWDYFTEAQTSEYLIAYEVEVNLMSNIAILAVAIFSLTIGILWITFRRFSYVLAPLLTLLISVIWTFGATVALGIQLTAIDIAVIPLIIGLGVDYSVHTSRRYQEELAKGEEIDGAVHISITHVGEALTLAVLTTVVAFLSNLTSNVQPIADFGIMCALGVFFAFILTLTFHSAFRIMIDRRARTKKPQSMQSHGTPFIDSIMRGIARSIKKAPLVIVLVTLVLCIAGFYGAGFLRTTFAIQEFLPEEWESISTEGEIRNDYYAGSFRYSYILVEDNIATPEALLEIDRIVGEVSDDTYLVGAGTELSGNTIESPISVLKMAVARNSTLSTLYHLTEDGLPDENCTSQDVTAIFDYLWTNDTEANPLAGQTFSEYLKREVHREGDEYTATVIRAPTSTYSEGENRVAITELEDDISGTTLESVKITGPLILTQDAVDKVQAGQISSTVVSVIFAIVILVLIYRSVALGSIAIIPVIASIAWVLGTMYVIDIPLNLLTVMVTALTVGLGIDYAIHVIERLKEELKTSELYPALTQALERTGGALFISAVTTIAGFGVLIFAQMPILQGFGIISSAMMVFSFITAAVVLPVPLVYLAKWKMAKGKEL